VIAETDRLAVNLGDRPELVRDPLARPRPRFLRRWAREITRLRATRAERRRSSSKLSSRWRGFTQCCSRSVAPSAVRLATIDWATTSGSPVRSTGRYRMVMKGSPTGDKVGLSKQPAPGGSSHVVRRIGSVAPEA
jgi:hypothetical protein